VLLEKHAAKLAQTARTILEPTQDLLTLSDRQGDSDAISIESRSQSRRRGLIDKIGQRTDELGREGDAGDDEHDVERIDI
jgi:hypothetical protein